MNLLYTITAYPPSLGGAQIYQHQLAVNLKNQHNIQVVTHWNTNRTDWLLGTTIRAPKQDYNYVMDSINVHRMGLPLKEKVFITPFILIYYPLMKVALLPIAACFEAHLRPYAEHADLIHNTRIGREGLSYASLHLARRHNIPFILTPVHHPRWVGWRYKAYNKLYKMANAIIALTNAEKQILIKLGVGEERIFVTGIGPVLEARAYPENFLEEHRINGPIILFLGQHYPYKGYLALLKAAPIVWKKIPDANFVFIGPSVGASEKHFKSILDKRIRRLGQVNLQEKTNALAACSILCVPSTQESFGGIYTEAWSFAKPVIGCNIPAVSEVISDEVDGYLIDQNPIQIAERICHLLLYPKQAQELGAAGHRKVIERYTWEHIAKQTEKIYNKSLCS